MTFRLRSAVLLTMPFLCCCPPAEPQSCTPAPPGLVSWWTGDANENDIIGGNNPQAVNAVTLVPGEAKTGFTFGNDGYIEIPAATNLANQQFTWAAWARPDGPGSTNDQYGSTIVLQNSDSFSDVIALDWRATPDSRFLFTFGNETAETIYSKDVFPSGSFYFVAVTYDGANFQLYVNGLLEASYAETKTVAYTSYPWVIGESFIVRPGFRTWNGVIDEVQAFNRALSASELQAIYNGGTAGVCKGLTFSPTSLKFPRRTVGTTSPPATVTASNLFPLAVAVRKVSASGDFAETNDCPVAPARLAPGATCAIAVTFTPTAGGTRTGKVTIADNAPASPQRVNLAGAATDVSLSVSRLNFGSHTVGTSSRAKTVTVTNVGSVTVNFTGSGIVLAGTDPTDYLISANTCGPSLDAGANCAVSIKFAPTASGARSATLEFNDDGGSSPQTVALNGTGT